MLYYFVNESDEQYELASNIDIPINISEDFIVVDGTYTIKTADIKDNKFLLFNTDTMTTYLSKVQNASHPTILHFYPRPYLTESLVVLTSEFNETEGQDAIIGVGKLRNIDNEFVGIGISLLDSSGAEEVVDVAVAKGMYKFDKLLSKNKPLTEAINPYINQNTTMSIINVGTGENVLNSNTKDVDLTTPGTYLFIVGEFDNNKNIQITDNIVSTSHYKEVFYVI